MSEPVRADTGTESPERPPVVVKKYANRRLYNTDSSSYITLDNLADMVRAGRDFVVYDAKSGEDITRGVLTQIIVEEESKGRAMLPTGFLRQLIGFYGDSLQGVVPRYLEQAMSAFARQQQQMRLTMQQTMGGFLPFGVEEVSRQNMAMMERAMSLFAPFYRAKDAGERQPPASTTGPAPDKAVPDQPVATMQEIAELHSQIEALQKELDSARQALASASPTQKSTSEAPGKADAASEQQPADLGTEPRPVKSTSKTPLKPQQA
jgi:polyhydroxyalkanoate synthesis repressor PhaR